MTYYLSEMTSLHYKKSIIGWINAFSTKDLGKVSYILGIRIYKNRSQRLLGLSHTKYLDKV